ncbi:hypothetical protein BDZ89DRAFT_695816 [Hymenopellis radicata]|nr:hypothetical protein BDZ89DRAFT_695816 [Hymenopellis radicata]
MSQSDTTTTAGYLRRTGEWILVGGLPVIAESIAWTVVLACFVAHIVLTSRKRRRGSPMIFIFSAMFALVSLQYAIDLFWFFIQARDILLQAVGDEGKITPADKALHLNAQSNVRGVLTVGNGSWLVSTLLGDLVVFWRAWELSSHNLAAKRMLVCPAAFLLSYAGTIPVVLVCQLRGPIPTREGYFYGVCGKKALVNWCLSLLSNLLSTCVIAYIGWGHRTEMRKLFHSTRRRSVGERILGLLAESGFIYFSVNLIFVITITSTPDTYSAGDVIATVFVGITVFVGAFVPMATHVIVLIYGSLWDTISEHSGLPTRNHVTSSIRFVTVSRISPEASLEAPESVPHGIQDVSKET